MTTSTGEDRDLYPATARRGAIPVDTYAHRLMLARAHAGNLSIRAAAERCGLNHANWANWEQGMRSRTAFDDARAISEGLGVDLEWLMWGGQLTPEKPRHLRRRDRLTYPVPARPAPQPITRGDPATRPPTFGQRPTGRKIDNRPAGHPGPSLRRAA